MLLWRWLARSKKSGLWAPGVESIPEGWGQVAENILSELLENSGMNSSWSTATSGGKAHLQWT